jgi:acetate CoA/acetoacetate CoA-transferase alpha subunit
MNKVMELDDVIDKVQDGASIMFGGFLGVGAPLRCIDKLVQKGVKDLTVYSIVTSQPGGDFDLAPLFKNQQVKKYVCAHAGTCPEAIAEFKAGNLEIEYFPMGSLIEKIRAGGAGLGGVLTPIGIGTLMEEGKQKISLQGKEYLVELPIRADFAFIKGFRADTLGNVQYRGVAVSTNPILATAAEFTVAEVNEIVDVGSIDAERVGTPCVFVKAVVQGYKMDEQQKVFEERWISAGAL